MNLTANLRSLQTAWEHRKGRSWKNRCLCPECAHRHNLSEPELGAMVLHQQHKLNQLKEERLRARDPRGYDSRLAALSKLQSHIQENAEKEREKDAAERARREVYQREVAAMAEAKRQAEEEAEAKRRYQEEQRKSRQARRHRNALSTWGKPVK